jgi:hypothetical protein
MAHGHEGGGSKTVVERVKSVPSAGLWQLSFLFSQFLAKAKAALLTNAAVHMAWQQASVCRDANAYSNSLCVNLRLGLES